MNEASKSARTVLGSLFGSGQDFSLLSWQTFRPGVEISHVYGDPASGPAAAFLRYAPGAQVPEHVHGGYEHIVVLRGSQRDEHGSYPAGTCLINSGETSHQVTSDEGCVVLAIWNQPVSFR